MMRASRLPFLTLSLSLLLITAFVFSPASSSKVIASGATGRNAADDVISAKKSRKAAPAGSHVDALPEANEHSVGLAKRNELRGDIKDIANSNLSEGWLGWFTGRATGNSRYANLVTSSSSMIDGSTAYSGVPASFNLAAGKPAIQSSTGWDSPASLAVDGNTDGNWYNGSVSHTDYNDQAWWQVDLGDVQQIEKVNLWLMTVCCSTHDNFYVKVSGDGSSWTSYYVAGPVDQISVPVNRAGRYVRVQLAGAGYLALGEVQAIGYPTTALANLSQSKSVTQSSTLVFDPPGDASHAVDGNTAGNYFTGSVTHTNWDNQPWWQVDLGAIQSLSSIKLWNRSDCCSERLSNFYVLVSDVPFTSTDLQSTLNQVGVTSYYTAGNAGAVTSLAINRTGRYVRVQLTGANYLSLTEVQVWGLQVPVIPGVIQAEYFDNGGEGVAYHDTTPGTYGQDYDQSPSYPVPSFRLPTDVDIYKAVNYYNNGYLVLMQAGDWMNHTVNVSATGSYTLQARVAWGGTNGSLGTFHIEMDRVDVTGPIQIPDTNWALTMVTKSGVQLTAGQHVMRVVADINASNDVMGDIDYLSFTPSPANSATFVSQSVPTSMIAGQNYNVSVTMRNTGTNSWSAANNYNLGSQNPRDNSSWATARVATPQSIAPGAQATFNFTVKAPTTTGPNNFQWRMVQDGVEWFGDSSSNVAVQVNAPPAPDPVSLQLYFEGRLRDRVSQNESLTGDGVLDGTFNVSLPFSDLSTITSVTLDRGDGAVWDTISNNGLWTLGVARGYDDPLINSTSGGISFSPVRGSSFKIFGSDASGLFALGKTFTVTVRFSDGTIGTGAVTIAQNESGMTSAQLDPRNRTGKPGVDLLSGNYNWNMPILDLQGRAGLDLNLALTYNSLVWTKDTSGTRIQYDLDQGFPSPGFRLGFPVIQPRFFNAQTSKYAYLMITPSGERVELRQVAANTYESADSSYLQLTVGTNALTLKTTSGTQFSFTLSGGNYRCTEIKDRNGNFITIVNDAQGRLSSITDTVGRVLTFNYDPTYGFLTSITQPWNVNGQTLSHKWAEFTYKTLNIQTNFGSLTMVGAQNDQNIRVLQRVTYADGSAYTFSYTSWGQVFGISRLASDGSQLRYTKYNLVGSVYPQTIPLQNDCPRFTQQGDAATNWNGASNSINGSSEAKTLFSIAAEQGSNVGQVTTPDGGVTKEFFATSGWQNGLTQKVETWSPPTFTNGVGWTAGALKRTLSTTWTQDNKTIDYQLNPRPVDVTVVDGEGNRRRRTHYDYSDPADPNVAAFGLLSGTSEFGLNDSTPLRRTQVKYNRSTAYLSLRVIGLVDEQFIYDGQDTLLAKTTYEYDQDGFLQATSATPTQHDSTRFGTGFREGRGNLSRVRRWDATASGDINKALVFEVGYNTTGSPIFTRVFSRDDSGTLVARQTNLSYTDALNSFAYPTSVTDPDGFKAQATYNYDMGAQTTTTDPKGATQTTLYDNVTGRVTRTELNNRSNPSDPNTGSYTRFVYSPNNIGIETYTRVDVGSEESYSAQVFDGAGRLRGALSSFPASTGGYRAQRFTYDVMGQLIEQSNPTEISLDPTQKLEVFYWRPAGDDAATGWRWSKQAYDWKGRPIVSTNVDGTQKTLSYEGCGCAGGEVVTASDEVGRKEKSYADALGRITRVEVLNPNDTIYSTTVSAYNALDQVTSIKKYRGTEASGVFQETTMTYDGYGRLATRHLPEQRNANNQPLSTSYQYNPDDTLSSVTDARGATINLSYNARRRVKKIVYGRPINPATGMPDVSVPATPTVEFGYDAAGNRQWMTDGRGRMDYNYNTFSQLTSETRFFNELGAGNPLLGRSYTLVYDYNLAGGLKSITDPFSAQVRYNYDLDGSLQSVTGSGLGVSEYISQVKYKASNQPQEVKYGNGLIFSLKYNPNLQVTDFQSSGKVDVGYEYYPDGRLRYSNDRLDNHFDRSYGFDHAARMIDARSGAEARDYRNGTTGGVADGPYKETFGHDEWDNMNARVTRHWSKNYTDGPVSITNNRRPDWNYDASGNATIIAATRSLIYDAANLEVEEESNEKRLNEGTGIRELITTRNAHRYDGEGQLVGDITTETNERSHVTETLDTFYYVRSSVLGGSPVVALNSAGDKVWRYVYANGKLILKSREFGSTSRLTWTQTSPSGSTVWNNDADGNVFRAEFDPLNAAVGLTDPYTTPPSGGGEGGRGRNGDLMGSNGTLEEMFDSGDCRADGVYVPCYMAMRALSSGAAVQCPNNDCGPRWNPNRDGLGHGGWQLFRPTDDPKAGDWYNLGPLDFSGDPRPTLHQRQYLEIATIGSLPGPPPNRRGKSRPRGVDSRKGPGQPGTRSGGKVSGDLTGGVGQFIELPPKRPMVVPNPEKRPPVGPDFIVNQAYIDCVGRETMVELAGMEADFNIDAAQALADEQGLSLVGFIASLGAIATGQPWGVVAGAGGAEVAINARDRNLKTPYLKKLYGSEHQLQNAAATAQFRCARAAARK